MLTNLTSSCAELILTDMSPRPTEAAEIFTATALSKR